ncbi:hypothetical protein EMIHUDRAFT_452690 [Emiliania huxleyi CCMP1516]|uniref:Plastid lipid-associated protein/fibrillin conserved domain-containing protein n=2 Tax=Emiliania huxleyi TaxID=2903 RepID=A0A0D3IGW6_EMIH1|nr:hypothetical protein EMIHUDRAFT_452690 [Emiliania huxleyi CCMP1516]EOD10501.1 hypothetical protein EMIHUDRAFT_452690 [Emiliania huxleyi CCMP1516]|eukprot:XP_005762930.1 hypothetical protein EMIHUDRAFT_452690 [Emiliania huxleyi CCMP1516]
MSRTVLLLCCSSLCASAYSLSPGGRLAVDDAPSDSAADEPDAPEPAFPDLAEELDVDEGSIAKEALKAEVADGFTAAAPDKAVLGEILLALESANPTRSPATSPLLNGKWKVLYASGATPSLKALMLLLKGSRLAPKSPSGAELADVQDAYLTIREEQPRAEGSLRTRLLSFENTIKLSSRLEAESAVRLVETYEAAESEYMSLKLPFQRPVQYKRSVLVSYLDDELLVVRDSQGRPDILLRVDEASRSPSSLGGEVSDDDENDAAPGAS